MAIEPENEIIRHLRGIRKIVINAQHGGFDLSEEAMALYKKYNRMDADAQVYEWELYRDDPVLVRVVQELGESANGRFASLKIVEIPADVQWDLQEYDGWEWIAEKHRTWR